jgi:type II secretion system protein J
VTKGSRKGFTLVEIMIAAVLASLVTLSAVAAVNIVTKGREKVERYSEASSELRYIAESMKKDLRNISRGSLSKKFVGELIATDAGVAPSLTFYTTRWSNVRKGEPEGDICEVQYTIGVHNGRNVMFRRVWPDPNDQLGPSGVVSILSDNIVGFEVKYLDDKEWRTDWPEDIGKDCPIMVVNIAAQVPGESQKIVKSFMMSFPRMGTASAQTDGTASRATTTTTSRPTTTTGSATGGAPGGRNQDGGAGRATGPGGRGGRGQNAEGENGTGGRRGEGAGGQGGRRGRPGVQDGQGSGSQGPGGQSGQGGQRPGGRGRPGGQSGQSGGRSSGGSGSGGGGGR